MAMSMLRLVSGAGVRFAGVRLRALGAARSACVIAFEPARIAVRVIALSVRWNERLQRVLRVRLAMTFWLGRSAVHETYPRVDNSGAHREKTPMPAFRTVIIDEGSAQPGIARLRMPRPDIVRSLSL
jgi:hypothetical protein